MEWYLYAAVVVAGFISGFINTVAGSGSLVSLPMLMYLGLPAGMANGTNRIAIFLQSLVGVAGFKQQKVFNVREGLLIAIPTTVGSLIGAFLAVDLDEKILKQAIGALLIIMFFVILLKPEAWIKGQAGKISAKPSFLQVVIFFAIGVYGGFIQAGVGFFLLAGLVLSSGYDLVKANAIKVLIVLLYTPFALAVFMYNQQVNYVLGLVLAAGSMAGAYMATRFAANVGPKVIRYILLVILLIAALDLVGFFGSIMNIMGK
ncbi:MAG TPA: hypothetical protein DCQ31_01745 [Bacteroidales bacterium]|nr:hypothetical protein [Bacteroidales bacterium]